MVDVDQSKYVFGDLQVLFAGDFGQLHPVSGTALFKAKDNVIWDKVTTYFELKSTHIFKDDPKWGELLQRFRWEGPTADDLCEINKRLTQDSSKIPPNAIYAVLFCPPLVSTVLCSTLLYATRRYNTLL